MAQKKYRLLDSIRSVYKVKGGDDLVQIVFSGGGYYPEFKGGVFFTSDVNIQKSIEAHPDFKKGIIYLDETDKKTTTKTKSSPKKAETKKKDTAKEETVTAIEEPTKFQEAVKYMTDTYDDVEFKMVNSKSKLATKAKEKGISFPNI